MKKKKTRTVREARQSTGGSVSAPEQISQALAENVGLIAEACDAAALLVYEDALVDSTLALPAKLKSKVIYVRRGSAQEEKPEHEGRRVIHVPDVPLTRMSQVKVAVFLSLSRGLIEPGDVVVCLSGVAESGSLDTLIVTEVGQELEMVSTSDRESPLPADLRPEVLERVVELASELGHEGREGKPVGALFVVGDAERVLSLTRQLILNPFRGYEEAERNFLDPELEETIKELCSLDGAFVLRGDGVVETCGAFLKTASQDEFDLPRGLGARHHAAAAITAVTQAFSVTVSESTGTVSVFRSGRIVTEIQKPRGQKRSQLASISGSFFRSE